MLMGNLEFVRQDFKGYETVEDFRRHCLSTRVPSEVDPEFLPYLDRIDVHAIPSQCCAGHVRYTDSGKTKGRPLPRMFLPRKHTGRWGYLHMAVPEEVWHWLHDRARSDGWDSWIWVNGSQLCAKGAKMPCQAPVLSETWVMIGFAWDARHWPRPAKDITNALEMFAVRSATSV